MAPGFHASNQNSAYLGSPSLACGAGHSIKPGVERSETPGWKSTTKSEPAEAGDRAYLLARPYRNKSHGPIRRNAIFVVLVFENVLASKPSLCRPLRGLARRCLHVPGVALRSTPGFMLSPAPQAIHRTLQAAYWRNDRIEHSALDATAKKSNAGLQLRRAISIQAEAIRLLEKHAVAPSAARLCWGAALRTSADVP